MRGEVSRLRKLLGAAISTDPYRLEGPVECDAAAVQALLRRGAVREAAERYAGPLLPTSDAPGVVAERDSLERWLRHAVMTGDDREALWAWVQTPSGRDDPAALKLALTGMEFRDPRRSQVAAQLAGARARASVPPRMDDLRAAVARQGWFHTIDLGGGIVTPGRDESPRKLGWIGLPADLSGRSVLDVGAWDGFFSFECERRGAARVVALDGPAWREPEWGPAASGPRRGSSWRGRRSARPSRT